MRKEHPRWHLKPATFQGVLSARRVVRADPPLTLFAAVRRREFGRKGGLSKFGAVYGTGGRVGNKPGVCGILWYIFEVCSGAYT